MITKQTLKRLDNHPHSEKSKAPLTNYATKAPVVVGDLVYLLADRNKSKARSRYLVTQVEGDWCNIRKFIGSQLRNTEYRIKRSECYRVPSSSGALNLFPRHDSDSASEDEDSSPPTPTPPQPPLVPPELSLPDTFSSPCDLPVPDTSPDLSAPDTYVAPIDGSVQTPSDISQDIGCDSTVSARPDQPCTRKSTRPRHKPVQLDDYITDFLMLVCFN